MEDSDSTKTQTFKDLSPAAFEKCLQLLKGPSDEERFTGLLIVSKAIRPDDSEKIRKVFDTIGFNFINRLVSSKQEDATSYKQLALNILASFCSVPELAQSPEILNKSSFFLDMIEANDDQHAIEDSFMCLASILVSEIGKLSVFQCVNHGVKSISKGITKITDPVQQLPKRLQALNQVVMFTRDNIRNFTEISQLAKDCALCIPTLSKIFKENQDQLKFDILDSLLVILSCTKDVPYENLVRSSDTWSEEIRLGLFDILASKVSEKQRNPALILTSLMIQVNDPQWSLGKKNSKGSEGVFLDLVIRLCRIEVQLILERPEIQKDTITLLSSCYSIIETAISHLSSGAWNCLSRERLQRLQESFTDIFTIVIQYLNYCKKINAKSDGLGLLSLRVLGVWLSEETSLLQKEVFEILPFVIQMEPDSSSELTTDPFPILLPALLNLTSEKPALDIFLSNKGHERLFDYLNKNCLNLINSIVKPRKDDTQTNQNYSLISSALGMVLNIISIESSSKINFNSLISLLPCFVSSMESLVNKAEKTEDGDSLYLLANFVTISLSVLRKYDQEKLSLNNKQEILTKLFLSIISFYKIPNITSSESVADLWFMSLYGLAECIGLYPLLVTTIVSGNLISAFSSYLLQMSEISQDELGVWNNIFINLSNKAPQAKNQLKSNGGMQICQRYGFKQLEQLLRTA